MTVAQLVALLDVLVPSASSTPAKEESTGDIATLIRLSQMPLAG